MVWVLGICFAVQYHYDEYLLALRTKVNGQGAIDPKLSIVEESELLFRAKWYVAEELRAQRVFADLVQDFGKAHALDMFSPVFMHSTRYPFGTTNSDEDSSDEASCLAASKETGKRKLCLLVISS